MTRDIRTVEDLAIREKMRSPLAQEFIAVAMEETQMSEQECEHALEWLAEVAKIIINDPDYKIYHISDLERRSYKFMAINFMIPLGIMTPTAGTAHDLANRLLLSDSNGGIIGILVQDKHGDDGAKRVIRLLSRPSS